MTDVEQGPMFPSEGHHDNRAVRDEDFKPADVPESRFAVAFETVERVLRMGRVEAKGIQPVPVKDRKSTRFWNIFTVWCSMNTNILG